MIIIDSIEKLVKYFGHPRAKEDEAAVSKLIAEKFKYPDHFEGRPFFRKVETVSKKDKDLLTQDGWIVECELPFEISLEDDPESRATGEAARMILRQLREEGDAKG